MTYTQIFGGNTIYPSDVSLLALTLTDDVQLDWPLEGSASDTPAARIIDVTTAADYDLLLPDASLTGAGQTILLNNLTASTSAFTVKDYAGGTLATVEPGEQWQLYLASTATAAGVWRVFRFGASTATVRPSDLAGYGLTTIGNTLSQSMPVVTFNDTPRTVLDTDRARALVWIGSGSGTLNLPTAADVGNNFYVTTRNSGGGTLTVDPSGSELVDGSSTLTLQPGDSATLATDGIDWYTVGLGQQAVFAFDFTSVAVTGGTYTLAGSELNRIAYRFTGTLVSDATVIVPPTVQQYWIDNATTGPFTLTVKTSAGTGVAVTQGGRGIYYCDGTNFIDADTSTVALPVSAVNGGTGQTSYAIGDLLYASAPTALSKLSDVAVGNALLSGGVGVAPVWGKIGLTTHVSGTLPITNGGTGATSASAARANLGATTVGSNLFTLANPSAIRFLRVNADNTVSALDASAFVTAIGAGSGTVTSVGGTGTVNGITLTGTVTSSGSLTLGGTLSGVSLTTQVTGTLPIANGGTGATTASAARTALGATTVGSNLFTLADPGAVTFLRANADNTVSALDAATFRSAIGAAASGSNTDITALDQDVSVTATGTIAATSIGYRGLPQNSQTSGYTLALSDAGKHISITTGGVVIPANGSIAFPVGTTIVVYNNSASAQTISITTDTLRQAGTANTGPRTLAGYGLATLVKVSSTVWVISGAGVS